MHAVNLQSYLINGATIGISSNRLRQMQKQGDVWARGGMIAFPPDCPAMLTLSPEAIERFRAFDEGRITLEELNKGSTARLSTEEDLQELNKLRKQMHNNSLLCDPFEFDLRTSKLGDRIVFQEGTLEHFIFNALEGRAAHPQAVALELTRMIRSSSLNPDASVAERAVTREMGMHHVRYIAENFFDDPAEGRAFVAEVNRFAENDILRERGYCVTDIKGDTPHRPYMSWDSGEVRMSTLAERFGIDLTAELNAGTFGEAILRLVGYLNMPENSGVRADITREFNTNSRNVMETIDHARKSLDANLAAMNLQRLLRAF